MSEQATMRRRPGAGWGPVLGRRLGSALAVLLGVVTITFLLTHLIGDPVALLLGRDATPQSRAALVRQLGLDRPLWVQYWEYLRSLARLDFGTSTTTSNTVLLDLRLRLPATLKLVFAAFVMAVVVSVPLGVLAGARPGGIADRIAGLGTKLGAALPPFWIGLLLAFLFTYELPVFPSPIDGSTGFAALVLPAATLAFGSLPAITQIARNTMASVMASGYIRTARASGIGRTALFGRYAFRNVLGPTLPVLAMSLGNKFGSTALVEVVYSWPGIGQYAVQAMGNLDYAPVIAVVILTAVFYIVGYLLGEVLHAAFDPRAKEGLL